MLAIYTNLMRNYLLLLMKYVLRTDIHLNSSSGHLSGQLSPLRLPDSMM